MFKHVPAIDIAEVGSWGHAGVAVVAAAGVWQARRTTRGSESNGAVFFFALTGAVDVIHGVGLSWVVAVWR